MIKLSGGSSRTDGTSSSRVPLLALAAATAANALLVLWDPRGVSGLALIALATAAGAVILRATGRIGPLAIAAAVVVLTATSVSRPPIGSHDVYSYAMYGRIAAVYHANPFVVVPAQFRRDPMLAFAHWHHTQSAYGPVFIAIAGALSALIRTSAENARLAYQLLAAAGTAAAAATLYRSRQGGARAAAMFVTSPVVWVVVVNGGHNDVLVGLLLVAAYLFHRHGHAVRTGLVLAVAVAIKLIALLALPVLVLALVRRRQFRPAAILTGVTTVPLVAAYVAWPQWPRVAFNATSDRLTRPSLWNLLHAGGGLPTHTVATLAFVSVAVLILAVLARSAVSGGDPATSIAYLLAVYTVVAACVLPWYALWALPLALCTRDPRLRWWVLLQAGWLAACYQIYPLGGGGSSLGAVTCVGGALAVAAHLAVVVVHPYVSLPRERDAVGIGLTTP